MLNNKNIRYLISILLLFLLVLTIFPLSVESQENLWWNKDWSFKHEMMIPFDTDIEQAKYQPIDTHINFENNCWAKDENEHSIRVISERNEITIPDHCCPFILAHGHAGAN